MQMFLKPLAELAEYSEIRDRMVRGRGIISLTGCIDAHKAHMIYGLSFDAKKVLVITENDMTARVLHEDLSFYYPEAALYPAKDRRTSRATCSISSGCGPSGLSPGKSRLSSSSRPQRSWTAFRPGSPSRTPA